MPLRVLIVRTDRIGDVLLTTPVARRLKEARPDAEIWWLAQRATVPILEGNPDLAGIIVDAPGIIADKPGPSARLVKELRSRRFDAAIMAFPRWRVSHAVWRAGIPMRIGPFSKLYSLLFSHRLRQHRSRGDRHEADCNLELLTPLGVPFARTPSRLCLREEETAAARELLESLGARFDRPRVILHPGCGGSAPHWPRSFYFELGHRLRVSGVEVIVTAGPGEDYSREARELSDPPLFVPSPELLQGESAGISPQESANLPQHESASLLQHESANPPQHESASLPQHESASRSLREPDSLSPPKPADFSLRQMAAVLSSADLVVTNSTGPLHMAVALGVPTVSIFSPTPTCHPRRWGPYAPGTEDRHDVLVAQLPPAGSDELSSITVEEVRQACARRLRRPTGS